MVTKFESVLEFMIEDLDFFFIGSALRFGKLFLLLKFFGKELILLFIKGDFCLIGDHFIFKIILELSFFVFELISGSLELLGELSEL